MNERQSYFLEKRTEKAFIDNRMAFKKAERAFTQHHQEWEQLKKYYEEYLLYKKNTEKKTKEAQFVINTQRFLSHLQGLLIQQNKSLNASKEKKEQYRLIWKKYQAKRKYLRHLRQLSLDDEEDEIGNSSLNL
ncbi:MAG: hypothetical protein RLZ35_651 [Pseudomonadota bacterium]|jgi:flagellar biosynthesis chaperone FliJ